MFSKQDGNRFQVEYIKAIPGGNDTALVLGKNYTPEEKIAINNAILKNDETIEQVGFVDKNYEPELQMAGGEFCGNATRSAAFYYLNGESGNLKIKVNGKDYINAGVYENKNAWCEIPLYDGEDVFTKKETDIYQIKMNGMTTIVIQPDVAKQYLNDTDKLKEIAVSFIEKYKLTHNEAVGVMFLEKAEKLKMHPVVWVRDIDTLFYETGCGSGTTATAMVEAFLNKKSQKLEIVQPSGRAIIAEITYQAGKVIKAVISGMVEIDNEIVKVDVQKKDAEENKMNDKLRIIDKEHYSDFVKLYKIFEKPPYSEKYSDQDLLEEFNFLTSGGHVYGYYENDICIGMVTYNKRTAYVNHPILYEHPENVAYLSDVTVLEEHRGKGIGTLLMKYAMEKAKEEGYDTMYMRTLQPGQSMSYGIAVKLGFKLLEETETITRVRHDKDRDETDVRIFLEVSLK